MEGSVLNFLKAEWKVSDTGSAHWASSFIPIHRPIPVPLSSAPFLFLFFNHRKLELLLTFLSVAIICHPLTFHNCSSLNQAWLTWSVDDPIIVLFFCDPIRAFHSSRANCLSNSISSFHNIYNNIQFRENLKLSSKRKSSSSLFAIYSYIFHNDM